MAIPIAVALIQSRVKYGNSLLYSIYVLTSIPHRYNMDTSLIMQQSRILFVQNFKNRIYWLPIRTRVGLTSKSLGLLLS